VEAPPRQRVEPRGDVGRDDLARVRHAHVLRSSAIRRLTRVGRCGCILALLALAACGRDDRAAFVESAPPPGLAERFQPPESWAWGEIEVGDAPVQRYGVAAATGVAKAQLLILPDYGESAETWFETARDLTASGTTVWVLEGVGQGGSGRLTDRRDLGELTSFDADVAATQAMIDLVIRPTAQRPLVLMGQGVGALVAARAVETGADPAALVLSAPDCRAGQPAGMLVFVGLGRFRAPGDDAWRRDTPDDFAAHRTHDAFRGAVTHAWQLANPSLRLGGASLDYEAALARLHAPTESDLAKLLGTPTLVLQPDRAPACLSPAGAQLQTIAGADPTLELEDTAHRTPWLTALERFIAQVAARVRGSS
jgi:lysophospholipase